jgi:hypothetical protein
MTVSLPTQFLVPVESKWIIQALDEFSSGKAKLYFGTDSGSFRTKDMHLVKTILFNINGDDDVSFKTDLIDFTDEAPCMERDYTANRPQCISFIIAFIILHSYPNQYLSRHCATTEPATL